ncbi:hypothetical protein MBRA_00546 [Methylobacterium brachiatum]|nr:hypothetical protein MBRA_00546 [Methylobacterium brachiatum]
MRALHHPPVTAQARAAVDTAARDARHGPTRPALVSAVWRRRPCRRAACRTAVAAGAADRCARVGWHRGWGPSSRCRASWPDSGGRRWFDRLTMSGGPRASVTRWRFVPALTRPVGFRPVAQPLFGPGRRRCPSLPRRQSISTTPFRRSRSTRCRWAHTSTGCESRRYRQHLIPQPQSISAGSTSHGMPERSANRMPVNAWLGSRSADGRLFYVGAAAAEAAQSRSRDHRAEADSGRAIATNACSDDPCPFCWAL